MKRQEAGGRRQEVNPINKFRGFNKNAVFLVALSTQNT
jgi:hypothetical protein